MATVRDNFSRETTRTLCDRVGGLCSNPGCRASTKAAHTDDDRALSVGAACHIHAAAPGGPRYDPSQTPEQRCAIDNGIWLCMVCGTLIDKDETRYPAPVLREWRAAAEVDALARVGKPSDAVGSVAGAAVELTLGYEKTTILPEIHHYTLLATITNTGPKRLNDWYLEIDFPTPLLEPGTFIGGFVAARSNARRSVIRTSNRLPPLHSGDHFKAKVGYRVDDHIYRNQQHLFDEIARASAFVGGERVVEVTRQVRQLQCF